MLYKINRLQTFSSLTDQLKISYFQQCTYENENACKNFIFGISKYLFEENVKKKLHLVNFIAILCDGSTDNSVIEQEVLYVIFTDPETFKPTMKFFEVVATADSQDAPGLKNAIFATFHEHSLESAKLFFFLLMVLL